MTVTIVASIEEHLERWTALRHALWPDGSVDEHRADVIDTLLRPSSAVGYIALDPDGDALGFAEATLRTGYVNGCTTTPVAFLEGLYVVEIARRQGIARALVAAIEHWAMALGCTELASDALIDNAPSHAMHAALAFEETERVVSFRKDLPGHGTPH